MGDEGLRHAAAAGHRFPYRQFFPEQARIAQIDIRAEALGNRCPLDLGVIGTVGDTLKALLPLIDEKTDTTHLDGALADYRKARADLDALAESGPNSKIIHPQYVSRIVSELADDDAIFSCDVGTPIAWTARYLKMNGKRRLVGSFNHGSMANAMLQAIGAQAAFPNRQVISFSGDGGFTMMMGEFVTLMQTGLPVKIIVLNNGTLGFRGAGDEGVRLSRHRMRPEEPELRRDGPGDGHQGRPRRGAAGS